MAIDVDQIRALVAQPSEALQVELKTWLDPRTNEGAAKIIKALFAIRNRNGGFLLIGFNNATLEPDPYTLDVAVETLFHIDVIQGLVSRYANPSFEISISFQTRGDQKHPVIVVPDGVRIPAVVRSALNGNGGKKLLQEGDLYFRTLNSNGIASSAKILPSDYADLLEICFENREADIGRFLRRHLGGGSAATLAEALNNGVAVNPLRQRAFAVIDDGTAAAATAIAERATAEEQSRVADALFMKVGLALDPARPDALPTQEFMNIVSASNPNFTGWPVWLDSRSFHERADRPRVIDGAWQALIIDLDGGWSQQFEMLRFDPRGNFYLQRMMQDDLTDRVAPGTALDVTLMIYRVAEVLAVGTAFGRSLGWETESDAGFAFRWSGLLDRKLKSWVNSFAWAGARDQQSRTATIDAYVAVPLETPFSALAPYVEKAVAPLFSAFDGYLPSSELVETSVRKLIERKLDS